MGLRPSSGILVVGAKGTGKSVLVRSRGFKVRPHEVYRGSAGEGEELIREVFGNALKAGRAIIHFKDIDVLCPARTQGRDKEARVSSTPCSVATLSGCRQLLRFFLSWMASMQRLRA
eukprot:753676-Hanusia_phi.AAC.5